MRGAAGLDPERFRVTVITGEGGRLLDEAARLGMKAVLVPQLVSPISPRNDAMALKQLTRLLGEGQFDVVHTHSAKAGALGRVAAHRVGLGRVVHTYHGFPFHQFQSRLHRTAFIQVERRLANLTHEVLAIGSGVATEAIRLGLADPTRLRTITPVVDGHVVRMSPAARLAARRRLGIAPDSLVVGTVGRLDFQKAPDDFVKMLDALEHRAAVGVWVGDGPERASTEARARTCGLGDRLKLLGDRDDVAEILPAFDVFAMTSRYEGLPCSVVEAMRCGVPVVATAVNSVPDLVVPGETGFLAPPGRPELTARSVDFLFRNPGVAARMSAGGRARTERGFDVSDLSKVLTEVYTGVSAPLKHLTAV